jgi:hypothetical protein
MGKHRLRTGHRVTAPGKKQAYRIALEQASIPNMMLFAGKSSIAAEALVMPREKMMNAAVNLISIFVWSYSYLYISLSTPFL